MGRFRERERWLRGRCPRTVLRMRSRGEAWDCVLGMVDAGDGYARSWRLMQAVREDLRRVELGELAAGAAVDGLALWLQMVMGREAYRRVFDTPACCRDYARHSAVFEAAVAAIARARSVMLEELVRASRVRRIGRGAGWRQLFGRGVCAEWVEMDGERVRVLTDFRVVLAWCGLLQHAGVFREDPAEAGLLALLVFFPRPPGDVAAALQWLERYLFGDEPPEAQGEAVIDLVGDYRMIWSGFRAAYGVDLAREAMDWKAFCGLLEELPASCAIKRAVWLRGVQPDPEGADYAALMELKQRYRIRRDEA